MNSVGGELVGMGTPRNTTERQLKNLTADRDQYVAKLKSAGKSDDDLLLDAKWRKLNGDVRQIEARLRAIATVEAREAAAVQAKADKAAAAAAE